MKVKMHKSFLNSWRKRILSSKPLSQKLQERIRLFAFNRSDPILKDHALVGKKLGLRAFSITGDIRVVYKLVDTDTALFVDIGSHNQVY